MSKSRRKKKAKKRRPVTQSLPIAILNLRSDWTVVTSKEISIAASVQSCFSVVANQLEQPPPWDPTIVDTRPVSKSRKCLEATSQVTLNLGGRELKSVAAICQYRPNAAISWLLRTKPRVGEDWRLKPKAHGTMVSVTLAREVEGWLIGRLLYKVMRQKRVEQDVGKMLAQLKAVAESINRT